MKGFFLTVCIVIGATAAIAQSIERSVVGSAGNEQKKSSIVLSSTIGEAAIQTLSKSSLTITQGFQQTLKSSTDTSDGGDGGNDTTSILEMNKILNMSLYPNPTHSSVNFMFQTNENYVLQVLDGAGKVVYTTEYVDQLGVEQVVSVQSWENGVYHFRFQDSADKISSYQVVKQ